jgi:hypothetical protein
VRKRENDGGRRKEWIGEVKIIFYRPRQVRVMETFWRNKVQVLCIVIFFTNKLQC